MNPISKYLIITGSVLIILGIFWHFSGGNIPLGRLPGDIKIKSGNSTFYFPITTCLLISAILSLISYFFRK
ncbi:MAG: hypothetical protein CME61_01320 [Halobacteriovoraceae bacterium]|nr:hypothetical protein [Halobacteriovoraceae bacterium]